MLATDDPPLTVAQYLALEAIEEGGVVGVDLARRAAVSPAAVSQLLATLEHGGLLTRGRFDDDRRRQPLALSTHGHAALRVARTTLRNGVAELLADLRPPEAEALTRLLERLQASLSGTPPPPRARRRPPPRPPGPKRHGRPRRRGV